MELDRELKQRLIELIKQGKPIPASYKNFLFPMDEKQKEYELIYGCKERKEDILADTMYVPFQPVKQFGKINEGEGHNKLIFGDNLQVLKYLRKLQDEGKLEKIKLIYIDPPFGTGDIYDAKGAPAYSAALQGAEFVEFLRKRLVFLRELLADDGSIYVRIDYHFGHYVKVIMDEVFGKNNFRNEIIINRSEFLKRAGKRFLIANESIFFYSKSENSIFYQLKKEREKPEWRTLLHVPGIRKHPERYAFGKVLIPPKGRRWTFSQEKLDQGIKEGYVRLNQETGNVEVLIRHDPIKANWSDIPGYTFKWGYPTENAEEILDRVIRASSNPGDLVIDCFAGSGTTGAVAEKLSRRWIMVDSSKLAIYTMIKRMFNLKQEIGNKGKPLKPKPFVLYNAGLYEDHSILLKLKEEQYKKFALELFQVESKDFEINGLKMDGLLFDCPVHVFSQKGYLTEEYVDDLHKTVGPYLKGRMFIIAPASRVYFLQDYIEKEGIRYYVLRIPYSVIDELHKRQFTRPMQPVSASEINQNIEQIGFDFIHPPKIRAEYYKRKPKDKLIEEELIIEIKKFEAVQRSKNPVEFKDPKDALSMVLVDRNYNGEYFNMIDYFFADQIKKENFKIRIPSIKLGDNIMIIYLDVLGNEKIELKSIKDFKKK